MSISSATKKLLGGNMIFAFANLSRWSLRTAIFSISSLLALLIDRNSSSISNPRYFLSSKFAAIPVVALPLKGSRIYAPGLVLARINLAKIPNGFCVGCLPHDFSQRPMAGNCHTSVICLSPLSCFIKS